MVNASLNWASIVGIVLAICGAGLYFMRSFKPALARDYDVFFAAIGLLCGGILFFQGWRLDPILQFGQFLLAGTTVFFAYESVRLRGVATDQARRSSYFDDELEPGGGPNRGLRGPQWEDSYDSFEEPQPVRRRFSSRDQAEDDSLDRDYYQTTRSSRAAIPEEAASRRGSSRFERNKAEKNPTQERRMSRFRRDDYKSDTKSSFGERRNSRQDFRRGSRPSVNTQTAPTRRVKMDRDIDESRKTINTSIRREGQTKVSSPESQIEDAAFSTRPSRRPRDGQSSRRSSDPSGGRSGSSGRYSRSPQRRGLDKRDNNSRFDD